MSLLKFTLLLSRCIYMYVRLLFFHRVTCSSGCALMHSLPGVHFHLPIPSCCPPGGLSLSQSLVSHRLWVASGKYLLPVSCLAFLVFVSYFVSFFLSKLPIHSATLCFRFAGKRQILRAISSHFFSFLDVRERAGCDFRCNKIESRSASTLKAL